MLYGKLRHRAIQGGYQCCTVALRSSAGFKLTRTKQISMLASICFRWMFRSDENIDRIRSSRITWRRLQYSQCDFISPNHGKAFLWSFRLRTGTLSADKRKARTRHLIQKMFLRKSQDWNFGRNARLEPQRRQRKSASSTVALLWKLEKLKKQKRHSGILKHRV